MEQKREPRNQPTHLWSKISITKEVRIYNGEKIIFLKSGGGKLGYINIKQ